MDLVPPLPGATGVILRATVGKQVAVTKPDLNLHSPKWQQSLHLRAAEDDFLTLHVLDEGADAMQYRAMASLPINRLNLSLGPVDSWYPLLDSFGNEAGDVSLLVEGDFDDGGSEMDDDLGANTVDREEGPEEDLWDKVASIFKKDPEPEADESKGEAPEEDVFDRIANRIFSKDRDEASSREAPEEDFLDKIVNVFTRAAEPETGDDFYGPDGMDADENEAPVSPRDRGGPAGDWQEDGRGSQGTGSPNGAPAEDVDAGALFTDSEDEDDYPELSAPMSRAPADGPSDADEYPTFVRPRPQAADLAAEDAPTYTPPARTRPWMAWRTRNIQRAL